MAASASVPAGGDPLGSLVLGLPHALISAIRRPRLFPRGTQAERAQDCLLRRQLCRTYSLQVGELQMQIATVMVLRWLSAAGFMPWRRRRGTPLERKKEFTRGCRQFRREQGAFRLGDPTSRALRSGYWRTIDGPRSRALRGLPSALGRSIPLEEWAEVGEVMTRGAARFLFLSYPFGRRGHTSSRPRTSRRPDGCSPS